MMARCQTRRILSKGLRPELGDAPLPLCPLPFIHRVASIHLIADKECSRKPIYNSANLYALGSEISAASHSNRPRWANNM